MIHLTVNDKTAAFPKGTHLADALAGLLGDDQHVLGAMNGGVVLELNAPLLRDMTVKPLTYADDEGRRIYERTLRFLFLMAIERLWPGQRVRIEHSLGSGLYITLEGITVNREIIKTLEKEMHSLSRADLPLMRERWSRERAMNYFRDRGQMDKVRLLSYRPYSHIYMYTCGSMCEYFYGAMLPSTSYTRVFGLKVNAPGLILQLPSQENPDTVAKAARLPKHQLAFHESNEWCRILKCVNVADLNDMIVRNELRNFIRVNEALHDKSIARIAEGIVKRRSRAVFIAGPSSSGKTTFAHRLMIHLQVFGLTPKIISLDDFYRRREEIPLQKDGSYDFEHLDALDLPQFNAVMKDLMEGKEACLPKYLFGMGPSDEKQPPMRLEKGQILIIEGIHGLNPKLHTAFKKEELSRVYISELTCLNLDDHNRIRTTDARLLRRIVRDYQFRGHHPDGTLSMWPSVRAGEEKWIFPYQEQADFVFNSVLHYELPVLRNAAFDVLDAIEPENPNYLASRRLIKMLHYLLPAPPEVISEIPPTSLLREFIGGCSFY